MLSENTKENVHDLFFFEIHNCLFSRTRNALRMHMKNCQDGEYSKHLKHSPGLMHLGAGF